MNNSPAFDPKSAKALATPFPHCETRRTIAFVQSAAEKGNVELFSATFQHIGTCTEGEFAAAAAEHDAAQQEREQLAQKANDEEHARRIAQQNPPAAEPAKAGES